MLKTLFSGAFRPLFLLVAVTAPLAITAWLLFYLGHWQFFAAGRDPLAWHMHEMLFGVIGAAVGGFLFTAVANWTGRAPLHGVELALLVALWLAGRIAMLPGIALDARLVAAADLAYLAYAVLLLWRELRLGGNRRNYVVLAIVLLLFASNLIYHLAAIQWIPAGLWGIRGGVMAVILLLALIGGRIIPAFTRNWLMMTRSGAVPPVPFGRLDGAAIAATVVIVPCWIVIPDRVPTALLMLLGALLHGIRLARWRGLHTVREPLLLVLHVGYGWIPVGFAVLGGSILLGLPPSAGVHALTAGAMTTMIMGVSSRAALGHTGRPLEAPRTLTAAFVLITLAALVRVAVSFVPGSGHLELAGALWVAAFLCFLVAVTPVLVRPRVASQSL